jgi:hypothetical protein
MFEGLPEASAAARRLVARMEYLRRWVIGEIKAAPQGNPITPPAPSSGNTPPAGHYPSSAGDAWAPPPSYGFHNPAPPNARRLQPEQPKPRPQIDPGAAQAAVRAMVDELRRLSHLMTVAAGHVRAIADALDARARPATAPPSVVAPRIRVGQPAMCFACGHDKHPPGRCRGKVNVIEAGVYKTRECRCDQPVGGG